VYSSLHFIELVLLDSKSYTNILENKRIVSLESNSGMRYRELEDKSDNRMKNREDRDKNTRDIVMQDISTIRRMEE